MPSEVHKVLRGEGHEAAPPQLSRICKLYYCVRKGAQMCCSDCERQQAGQCIYPCLNSPDHCGAVGEIKEDDHLNDRTN